MREGGPPRPLMGPHAPLGALSHPTPACPTAPFCLYPPPALCCSTAGGSLVFTQFPCRVGRKTPKSAGFNPLGNHLQPAAGERRGGRSPRRTGPYTGKGMVYLGSPGTAIASSAGTWTSLLRPGRCRVSLERLTPLQAPQAPAAW